MRARSIFLFCLAPLAIAGLYGCGDDAAALGECPSGANTQEGQAVLQNACLSCHSTMLTGAARNNAPDKVNVDDAAYVKSDAGEIYEEVSEGAMPPAGKLSDADIEAVRVYLACTVN